MNCRDFQNEFEDRAGLSDAANLHLKDCADCENLRRQQSHIWQMIESLPEVAAPADFNAQFRSRVARSEAGDFRHAWWKSLRYVVPAFAAVLVLTMVFASQNFFVSTPQTKLAVVLEDEKPTDLLNNKVEAKPSNNAIATTNSNFENANFKITSNTDSSGNSPNLIQKTPLPETAENQKDEKEKNRSKSDDDFVGSRDFGVNSASPPTLPNGFPSENKTSSNPEDFMKQKNQDVKPSLSVLGIETVAENGGLRIVSVKNNSIAARSGLKTGDLIQSIDGKNPLTNAFNTISNLTILRGTQILTISTRAQ